MGTFFKAFGIVTLVVLVVVVLAVAVIVWKVKRFFRGLAQGLGGATPQAITLERDDAASWSDADKAEAQTAELRERGFLDAGTFRIPALGNLVLRGFVKPADASVAAVYEHPAAGVITDLVTRYPDKSAITVTSAEPTGLDTMPGKVRVNMPGGDAAALYERMLAERAPGKAPRRFAASEFAPFFEQAYADEMAWRKTRGGATAQEIRNVAAKKGRALSDQEVSMAQEAMRRKSG